MSSIATKKHLAKDLTAFARGVSDDSAWMQGQQWPVSVVSVDGAIVTVAFQVQSDFTLPQVTCPIAESRYVRLPVRAGDLGMVVAASARLGGVTGLGTGLAPLTPPSNLGALVFVPLGNKTWYTIDPDAVVIQAPNGSKILTDDGESEIIIDPNQVKVTQGEVTVTITGGNVTINAPNNVTITVPQTTINGDLAVNGDVVVTGNVGITGNTGITGTLDVDGAAVFASSVACASMVCAGLGAFATLTIGGHPFTAHVHSGVSTGTHNTGGVV